MSWSIQIRESKVKGDGRLRFGNVAEDEKPHFAALTENHCTVAFFGSNNDEVVKAVRNFGVLTRQTPPESS